MTGPLIQVIPRQLDNPIPNFVPSSFDALIYEKGYSVFHERAIVCPCKTKGGDNLTSCQNCLGTGWVFINKIQTRMISSSINLDTKFKSWSEERIGTVSISARTCDRLTFMDRITAMNAFSILSQMIYPSLVGDNLFAMTIYKIQEIQQLYQFNSASTALIPITDGYTLSPDNENVIIFDKNRFGSIENLTFSITYLHPVTFHVIDLLNEIRNTQIFTDNKFIEVALPVHAIARRTHYVLDKNNFSGNLLIKN